MKNKKIRTFTYVCARLHPPREVSFAACACTRHTAALYITSGNVACFEKSAMWCGESGCDVRRYVGQYMIIQLNEFETFISRTTKIEKLQSRVKKDRPSMNPTNRHGVVTWVSCWRWPPYGEEYRRCAARLGDKTISHIRRALVGTPPPHICELEPTGFL